METLKKISFTLLWILLPLFLFWFIMGLIVNKLMSYNVWWLAFGSYNPKPVLETEQKKDALSYIDELAAKLRKRYL